MTIRLLLADDHRIILEGLEQLFRREKDFEVVATATTGEKALEAVRKHRPDILVLDIRMPDGDGLWVLKQVHREKIQTRVVLLTATLDEDEVLDAMQSGVSGLVLKEAAAVNLVETVRRVQRGERALEPETPRTRSVTAWRDIAASSGIVSPGRGTGTRRTDPRRSARLGSAGPT